MRKSKYKLVLLTEEDRGKCSFCEEGKVIHKIFKTGQIRNRKNKEGVMVPELVRRTETRCNSCGHWYERGFRALPVIKDIETFGSTIKKKTKPSVLKSEPPTQAEVRCVRLMSSRKHVSLQGRV
jgi:hypothetical protein